MRPPAENDDRHVRLRRGFLERFGVIGWPIGHSLSPALHTEGFRRTGRDASYVALAVPPEDLGAKLATLAEAGFRGLNVTIPHKERVRLLVEELTDEAREIGAVNTLVREKGRWRGDNTDGRGFLRTLPSVPRRALVLGSGGAARAVVHALRSAGAEVAVAARNPATRGRMVRDFGALALCWEDRHAALPDADLVVNATPVGLGASDGGASPLADLRGSPEGQLVYDLVYRPLRTPLLRQAAARGLPTMTGLPMLAAQAALSWLLWFGEMGPEDVFREQVERLLGEGEGL